MNRIWIILVFFGPFMLESYDVIVRGEPMDMYFYLSVASVLFFIGICLERIKE